MAGVMFLIMLVGSLLLQPPDSLTAQTESWNPISHGAKGCCTPMMMAANASAVRESGGWSKRLPTSMMRNITPARNTENGSPVSPI